MKLYWMRDNLKLNLREVLKNMPMIRAYGDVITASLGQDKEVIVPLQVQARMSSHPLASAGTSMF